MKKKLNYKEFRYKLNQPKYKSYTYLGGSIFISIFLTLFFIRPTLNELSSLIKTIESGKQIREQLTIKLENLSSAEKLISKYSEHIYLVDTALPEVINSPNIVDNITNNATTNNVIVKNFQISGVETEKEEFGEKLAVSISLVATGNYKDIIGFINSLEENQPIINTTSLSLNNTENDNNPSFTANLQVKIYGYDYKEGLIETNLVPFSTE